MLNLERGAVPILLYCLLSGMQSVLGIVPDDGATKFLLMIGNSYTRYSNMPGMLQSMLSEIYADVQAFSHTPDGYLLHEHLEDAEGVSGENVALRKYLVTEPKSWTWVTLQEQSQEAGFVDYGVNFRRTQNACVELNKLIEAAGGDTFYYQTWGRRTGDSFISDLYPDFLTMNELLRRGYRLFNNSTSTADRPTYIAPVGSAFQYIYESTATPLDRGSKFWNLYNADGSHPSLTGSYLAACLLFGKMTKGVDPRDLAYIPSKLSESDAIYLRSVAYAVLEQQKLTLSPTVTPVITTSPPNPRPTLFSTPSPIPASSVVPTPTPTLVSTPVPTPTPTPVPTPAPTLVPTPVPTPMPTPVPTPVRTPAPTRVQTSAPTLVSTPAPTPLPTPLPTNVATQAPSIHTSESPSHNLSNIPSNFPINVEPTVLSSRTPSGTVSGGEIPPTSPSGTPPDLTSESPTLQVVTESNERTSAGSHRYYIGRKVSLLFLAGVLGFLR